MDYKKLSEVTLAHLEKCELTGESFADYIDYSIPYERAIRIQGFQSDQLIREACKILRENGYCTRTGRLDIHINNIIANILNYKNRYNVHYFYYPAHKNEYYVPKRYNPLRITYNPFRASIEGLIEVGFIKRVKGFYSRKKKKGKRSRLGATKRFLDLIQRHGVKFENVSQEKVELIQLKNNDKKLIDYEDNEFTIKSRKILIKHNKLLKKTKIVLPQIKQVQDYIETSQDSFNFSRNNYVRIFNNCSFEQGGRFYGPWWQQIKSRKDNNIRKLITINGNATVELDFNAQHIHFLYSKEGLDYYKLHSSNSDPYTLDGFEEHRTFVKMIILIALNMKTKITSIPYVIPKLLKDEEFFIKKFKYTDMLRVFSSHHQPITKYICSGIGIYLQNMDSLLSNYVIKKMTNNKIPILNIHDSFIIEKKYENILRDTMNKSLRHFKIKSLPRITIK